MAGEEKAAKTSYGNDAEVILGNEKITMKTCDEKAQAAFSARLINDCETILPDSLCS